MEEPIYQPGNSPIYTTPGARPRPMPGWQATRPSWRGPLLLLMVMFGWMLIVVALASFAAPAGLGSGAPINVGLGVVVTPAGGWDTSNGSLITGPSSISLERSGAQVAFAAEPFSGGNDALLTEWADIIKRDFGQYRPLPSSSTTVAGDVAGLKVLFTAVSGSSRVEGELVVATTAGTGVIVLAVATPGQLTGAQRDLDTMLQTLQVPR